MIPQEVIEKDRALQGRVQSTHLELDQLRWEQCADPNGPRLIQQEYADAVGVKREGISRSVKTWAEALAAQNPQVSNRVTNLAQDRPRGGRPQAEATQAVAAAIEAGQQLEPPTPEVHKKARAKVRHSQPKAEVVSALAIAFGSTPEQVIKSRKPDWPFLRGEVAARATEYMDQLNLSRADACAKAAQELKAEYETDKTPRTPTPAPAWSIDQAKSKAQIANESLVREAIAEHPEGYGDSDASHAADVARLAATLTAFHDWLLDPSQPFIDPNTEWFDLAEGPLFVADILGRAS